MPANGEPEYRSMSRSSSRDHDHVTVGPVIGLVTESTARVLVECAYNGQATCSVTPTETTLSANKARGSPDEKTLPCTAGRPFVFKFSDLMPQTKYVVRLSGSGWKLDNAGSFWTVPEGGYKLPANGDLEEAPNFAVCSCNKFAVTRDIVGEGPDLWSDLGKRIEEGDIDYLFHLGDNVYIDSDFYLIEKGKKVYGGDDDDCKWITAKYKIQDLPPDQWHLHQEEIREIMREAYRETWGHPPTAFVLANVPNLMIFDDHDIRDDWGDRDEDRDPTSVDFFLATQAYYLIQEYQTQLRYDVDLSSNFNKHTWPKEDYFFYVFGEVGVHFQDVRGCKSFHRTPEDEELPMLGQRQWRDLDAALAPGGMFEKCRMLIICMPEPPAYIAEGTTMMGAKVVDDLYGSWLATPHVPEASRFANALLKWRAGAEEGEREVILLGGDVHEGGWTVIQRTGRDPDVDDDDAQALLNEDALDDVPDKSLRSLTTSAISNKSTKCHEHCVISIMRNLGGHYMGGGYDFYHYDWTNARNYALVKCLTDENGCAVYEGKLVCSTALGFQIRAIHDGAYDPRCCEDCCFQVKTTCTVL